MTAIAVGTFLSGLLAFFIVKNEPLILGPMNLLPLLALFAVLLLLTRRVLLSVVVVLATAAFFITASQVKYEQLKIPLLASDFVILTTLSFQGGVLAKYLSLKVVMGILGAIIGLMVLIRFEPKVPFLGRKSTALISAAIVAAVFWSPAPQALVDYYAGGADWRHWDPAENVERNGLFAVLTNDFFRVDFAPPVADFEKIDQFLDAHPEVFNIEIPSGDLRPDVLVLLLESFFDPGVIAGVETCDYLPSYCALRGQSTWGTLEVPTYGGNTIRTEFEILMGVSLDSYPSHVFPYLSLVAKPLNSYPRFFREQGYQTSAIHPHRKEFWNRTGVYPLMDIEEFIGREGFKKAKRDGWYIADTELLPKINAVMQRKSPQFNITITMENHGPWGKRKNINEDELQTVQKIDGLSDSAGRQWQEYVYHLRHSDALLAKVAEMVQLRDKPTILLAFGDHLPSLPEVFSEVEFANNQPPEHQKTPYLMIDNFSQADSRQMDISADLVMSEVVARAGIARREFDLVSHHFLQGYASKSLDEFDMATLRAFQIRQYNSSVTAGETLP